MVLPIPSAAAVMADLVVLAFRVALATSERPVAQGLMAASAAAAVKVAHLVVVGQVVATQLALLRAMLLHPAAALVE